MKERRRLNIAYWAMITVMVVFIAALVVTGNLWLLLGATPAAILVGRLMLGRSSDTTPNKRRDNSDQ